METKQAPSAGRLAATPWSREPLVRQLLERLADKWTLMVLEALEQNGTMRFTRLREAVGGVSQKMLTRTLRQLEEDGLVTRHVYPVVPPRVDYRLTAMGQGLSESLCDLWRWARRHARDVDRARRTYAARRGVGR
jgi:DNA-binding HxlR family transcriptional regulator